MAQDAIVVQDLHKAYDSVVAVQRLTFEVHCGEIFGLLGPNGAGKTTTIRMLMDIIKPDSGVVHVLGRAPGAARRNVGYLPEERGLYRSLQVLECLVYLGQLKGVARRVAEARALQLLERVEIAAWARRKVEDLSRGMQQKVQIVASLIHDPDLVILDEPFQGLDPVNAEMVRGLILELRRAGKTVVLSAHEMSQVELLCERIALIDHGRVVLYGPLADLKRQFAPHAVEIRPPMSVNGWPEVTRAEARNGHQRVYLTAGADPRAFLKRLLDSGQPLEHFEQASASLDEIFITVVKGRRDGQ